MARKKRADIAVEYVSPDDLKPDPRNAREHSGTQIRQIAKSIREFGFNNPVLVDEHGGIIAGHGRWRAAQELELDRIPCVRLVGLTPAQKRAYMLADNKIALNATWDFQLLADEMHELMADGFDMKLTGFSVEEIQGLINPEPLEDDVRDGTSEVDDFDDINTKGAVVKVGMYEAKVTAEQMRAWIVRVRGETDGSKAQIREKIIEWLQFPPVE